MPPSEHRANQDRRDVTGSVAGACQHVPHVEAIAAARARPPGPDRLGRSPGGRRTQARAEPARPAPPPAGPGRVLADRYHRRVLRTPREVRNALAYVLLNARRDAARLGRVLRGPARIDPASSGRWVDGWSASPSAPGREPPGGGARAQLAPPTRLAALLPPLFRAAPRSLSFGQRPGRLAYDVRGQREGGRSDETVHTSLRRLDPFLVDSARPETQSPQEDAGGRALDRRCPDRSPSPASACLRAAACS